ncbi:MAG: radical SAM protein [Lachnospiraceae bacterium]|nr:radical SAM protein [Lachnospiraceae bacterium]
MAWEASAQIRRALTQKGAAAGVPVSGTFELTPRCNLRCTMCYVRLTPEQMAPIGREQTAEEWLALAREATDAGMTFLLLTGGEPMLRSDFPMIYEGLAQMGLSISINTNGTLLSPELKELFHRLPPAQVNITLYGVCSEDYAALCGSPEAYDRMLDALQWFRSEGILVHLNCTMIPDNLNRWELFEEFAPARDLELRMTTYCFPPARRCECKGFSRLSPEEAGELSVKDVLYREGIEVIRKRAANLERPLSSCKLDLGDPIQCMAAKSQFWITWDGRMVPCGMLSEPVVRPFENGFLTTWQILKEETSAIRLCPDCTGCEERNSCMNCAAVTFTETGRFDGKPEYACRMNRAYRQALKKYAGEHYEG